jgi:hypothetical protein
VELEIMVSKISQVLSHVSPICGNQTKNDDDDGGDDGT